MAEQGTVARGHGTLESEVQPLNALPNFDSSDYQAFIVHSRDPEAR